MANKAPYSFRLNANHKDEFEIKEYLDQWLTEDANLPIEEQLGLRGIMIQVFRAYMTGVPKPPVGRHEYRLERAITAQIEESEQAVREYIEDLEKRIVQKLSTLSVASPKDQPKETENEELDDSFVDTLLNDFQKNRKRRAK